MEFVYDKCLIPEKEINSVLNHLRFETENLNKVIKEGYETGYASINLPKDDNILTSVNSVIKEKKALNPKVLFVIGIGGSNLGTIAVHEAVQGIYYNDRNPPIKVYFADTIDDDKISEFIDIAEDVLKGGDNILVNVISKSGKTMETAAIFEVFLKLLKKHKGGEYAKYVVATSDEGSHLWDLAKKEEYSLLEIPKNVGGRYSVFSTVGLFPLGMLGLDIIELRKGASDVLDSSLTGKNNLSAISATITYNHIKKGRNINDKFIFSSDMEAIGKWYRQLMGESIGKEYNRDKSKKLNTGMTPTISIGSTDLHSMAQLYLGGPQDKLTTFIRVEKTKKEVVLPKKNLGELVDNIEGKSMHELMDAILDGIKIAFNKSKRPFVEVVIPDKKEYSIAQLLQFMMLEMIYLGYLLNVNPFNQPNVEEYKKETRRILSE